jgi:hypothetical protein
MPTIGDTMRFAAQYELDMNSGGEWMFGRFCYWCDGQVIGDFELGTSLRDVLFQLEDMTKITFSRTNVRLSRLRPVDAFRLLDAALFGNVTVNNQKAAEQEEWAKHNIIPPVDVFDHWKAFAVDDERVGRVLFARDPCNDVRTVDLKPGEVGRVIKATCAALLEEHERAKQAGT